MRKLMYCLTSLMVLVVLLGFPIGIVQADKCELPDFSTAKFSHPTDINNAYFPLVPGTIFLYEPVPNPDNVQNFVEVLYDYDPMGSKQITVDGKTIDCIVVHDYELDDGVLAEDTYDWYAQDDEGNVWYCGEDTQTLDENGNVISTEGSWEAGVDGALPGYLILVKENLRPGICYQQEYYEDVAQDEAKVMRLNAKVGLENGDSYRGCLETKEWSPLELGDIEQKFYAEGVGLVLNFEHHGKIVRNELISKTP